MRLVALYLVCLAIIAWLNLADSSITIDKNVDNNDSHINAVCTVEEVSPSSVTASSELSASSSFLSHVQVGIFYTAIAAFFINILCIRCTHQGDELED